MWNEKSKVKNKPDFVFKTPERPRMVTKSTNTDLSIPFDLV